MWVHFDYSERTEALTRSPYLDFSRKDYTGPPIKKLIDVINYVKPTALFGLSTVKVLRDVVVLRDTVLIHVRIGCL